MTPSETGASNRCSGRPARPAGSALHMWGIDHHRATTAIREMAYLSPEQIQSFQQAFAREDCGIGAVVLCTCNRTEIYLEVRGGCRTRSALSRALASVGIDSGLFLGEHGLHLSGLEVVQHLYRVTAGLESMLLGEPQISGQIRLAYQVALENHRLGPLLMRAFQGALRCGKRARSETGISAGALSVAYTAVEEAKRLLGDLAPYRGLLLGAGKTGSLAARHILRRGIGSLTIINRSLERAETVAAAAVAAAPAAEEAREAASTPGMTASRAACAAVVTHATMGIEPGQRVRVLPFSTLEQALCETDVVLTATGSPQPLLSASLVARAAQGRNGVPLTIFDIAVPRDVHPAVRDLDRVRVIGLDELSRIVHDSMEARRQEIPRVEQVIAEELQEFQSWSQTLEIKPTVREFRSYLESLAEREMGWIRRKESPETAQVVEQSLRLFIGKLLQRPVQQLKAAACGSDQCRDLESLQRLFRLGGS